MAKSQYELHLEARRRYAEDNSALIKQVCGDNFPTGTQHILWMKTVSDQLEDGGEHKTFRSEDGTFGFTEQLVNRLMHFAYMKGVAEFDQRSYRRGWEEGLEAATKAVNDLG